MSTPKRIALAFGCTLLGAATLPVVSVIMGLLSSRHLFRLNMDTFSILLAYALFALPGWVLSLPFVVLFRTATGYRFLLILLIGTAIGPAFMLGWSLLSGGWPVHWQSDGLGIVMALYIALPTSLYYALLLRSFGSSGPSTLPQGGS